MDSIPLATRVAYISSGPCSFILSTSPWLCTKRKYIHMSILIQGPTQPATDINLYLELLKEELDTLWNEGVETWDAFGEEYFTMKAALITTV